MTPFSIGTRRGVLLLAALAAMTPISGCRPVPVPPRASRTPPPPASSTPASPIRFRNVTAEAGIRYRWSISGSRPLTILQTIGNGCALLDYDNDNHLDALFVGTDRIALYRGDGRGRFADVSGPTGLDRLRGHFLGCAVGDYDNDGHDDLYVSGYRTGLLLRNQRGKSFADVTRAAGLRPQPWGTSCAFVETAPGSGKLDLFVANYVDFGPDPKKYPQLCETKGHLTSCSPRYYGAVKGTLYRNDGHGRFVDAGKAGGVTAALNGKGLGVGCAPLDGSRRPFIAVANDEMAGDLLQPADRTVARYTNIAAEAGAAYDRDGNTHAGMGIDWGDYDNDGRFDLIVTTYQGETKSLYHNEGRLLFTDASYATGLATITLPMLTFGVKWADFDNDGWLDLLLASGHVQDNVAEIDPSTSYRQPTQLLRNAKGRQFVDLSGAAGGDLERPIVGRGLAVGDVDNDGGMDALIVDSEGEPLLLHNESPGAGHWISLLLVGGKSNRNGYGAVVTVKTPEGTRTRLCHADGSYLSSSDKRVSMGLGAATVAQTLTVRWPDGSTVTLPNVAADRFYRLREGKKALETISAGGSRR